MGHAVMRTDMAWPLPARSAKPAACERAAETLLKRKARRRRRRITVGEGKPYDSRIR
jgi:hypothetical protein